MNVEALKALAKSIETEANITWGLGGCDARKAFPLLWKTAMDAYLGSLDAAKALHETVLPEWVLSHMQWWPTSQNPASVEIWGTQDGWHCAKNGRSEAKSDTPARAWLLAIIRALIAQGESKE